MDNRTGSLGLDRQDAIAGAQLLGTETMGQGAAINLGQGLRSIDDDYSNRFIALDPAGYFIIYIDRSRDLICADHFSNAINEAGLATDPDTGEVLACKGSLARSPTGQYSGRTAKELGIAITELANPCPVSCLDHALYLGREFVRAELALVTGTDYVQD